LLVAFPAPTGAASAADKPVKLTPGIADDLEPPLREAVARRHYRGLGVEVEEATTEGIAAWLRFSAERDAPYSVVYAKNLITLDADARTLRVVPEAQARALEVRLLMVAMLLRELSDLPLRRVEIDGPLRLASTSRGRKAVVGECERRGDVALKIGGTQVLP
jgi:hypothetical protein